MDNNNVGVEQNTPTKKIFAISLTGLLFLIIIFFLFVFFDKYNKKESKIDDSPYKITKTESGKLPDRFPLGFPIAKDVSVDGYNASFEGGFQSTIHYQSKETLDSLFKMYNEHLNKSKTWAIQNTLDLPSVKSISAKNTENTIVTVSIAQNTLSKTNQVTISFDYVK